MPLPTQADWLGAARQIIQRGQAQVVALSLGEQGALLVTADLALRAPALDVPVASTIGAGDSFLAGLVWALGGQGDLARALRYGMAAGAAALLVEGTALSQAQDVQRLYTQATVVAL
jgi:6-phosphofructokinase 2